MWKVLSLLQLLCVCVTSSDLFNGFFSTLSLMNFDGPKGYVHPEAKMTAMEVIRYNGYPAEKHKVITSDGYILEMHRIPYGKGYHFVQNVTRPPVFMQHGFMSSSGTFVINGPDHSPGFILADEGYDVWLANVRGNMYSRRHVSISPDNNDFWNFSLDDHALVDLPAMIDYVLKTTGFANLTFIGHSMGSNFGILMLSGRPEYNSKIKMAILQAPVLFGDYLKNPLRILARHVKEVLKWYSILGTKELLPSTDFSRGLMQSLCSSYPGIILCESLVSCLGGYNEELLDLDRLAVYLVHISAGSSVHVFSHSAQIFNTQKLTRYDLGSRENQIRYGQLNPPEYDLTKITAPNYMFFGYMDLYSDIKEFRRTAKSVPNFRHLEMVPHEKWTHQDFVMAKNLRHHHYNRILELLEIQENK